jgi:hypothetical protein
MVDRPGLHEREDRPHLDAAPAVLVDVTTDDGLEVVKELNVSGRDRFDHLCQTPERKTDK